ncbi:hypothetical protein GCM10009678_15100 [Actinomadura kijaniata]|uniref:Uncharacterized protein n=1 Tax=Actinomadura namibiensis TaxID=182080 RepID=A0A7W3QML1_ACTNM|nr:hypothetical protein [Actinomadura namibiensis]MBA8952675.1 hypothetical protein [Actinomadura namibiensis]
MVYSDERGGCFGDGHVNRQQLEESRAYLHTLAARVLALPGAKAPEGKAAGGRHGRLREDVVGWEV